MTHILFPFCICPLETTTPVLLDPTALYAYRSDNSLFILRYLLKCLIHGLVKLTAVPIPAIVVKGVPMEKYISLALHELGCHIWLKPGQLLAAFYSVKDKNAYESLGVRIDSLNVKSPKSVPGAAPRALTSICPLI